jgi:hypothetical protein
MALLVKRRGVDGDDPRVSVGKRTGGTCLEGARVERGMARYVVPAFPQRLWPPR